MTFAADELRRAVERLLDTWRRRGLPGRDALVEVAGLLDASRGAGSLWPRAPAMLTATIDDGIGQGIDIIGRFAGAVGVQVVFDGLLLPPKRIVESARRLRPDLVGLTVLQLDSEPELAEIARGLGCRRRRCSWPAGRPFASTRSWPSGPVWMLSQQPRRIFFGFCWDTIPPFRSLWSPNPNEIEKNSANRGFFPIVPRRRVGA